MLQLRKKVVEYGVDLLKVRRLSYIPLEHPWIIERTQRRAFDAMMTCGTTATTSPSSSRARATR
jgi:hypothetical protein